VILRIKSLKNNILDIWNHSGFRRYLSNTGWLFLEKVFRLTVSFFVGVWVARYLGPKNYGYLSYAQAFVGLFGAIASLGLEGILVRELVKFPEKEKELLGTAFLLKLFGAFVSLLVIVVAVQFTQADYLTRILVFIVSISLIFQSFNVVDLYFQAKVKVKYAAYANALALFFSSLFKVFLIFMNASLIWFAVSVLLDKVILSMGYLWGIVYFDSSIVKKIKFKLQLALKLLKDSWPLIISGLAIAVYMRIDQVMIQNLLDAKAVGQYTVAVRLSEIWYFIPIVITSSLFPAIINAKKKDKRLYHTRLLNLYSFLAWLAIGIAVPMTFFGDWIVNILYGEAFKEAASVLKIYIWASLFVFLGVASNKWLVNENLQIYSTINTFLGAVANIILNFILIKKFGVIGAAWATLFSQALSAYFSLYLWEKTRFNFYLITKSLIFKKY